MQKIKKIITFMIFIIIITLSSTVFADDEIEEEFDFSQMNEFLQTVTSDVNKLPNINSRYAVIYDRKTRNGIIWEKGKCKM